jgi:hypothetical protein
MAKKTTNSEVVEEEIIETTEEEIAVENRAILIDAVEETPPDENIIEDEMPETQQIIDEETPKEEKPKPREAFDFKHPKRDLVFAPGSGGNFFATMIYNHMRNQYIGTMEYFPKINEYSVTQNMSQVLINGDSRNNVVQSIRQIPQRLEKMRDYIIKLQEVKSTDEFDWMIADMNNILSVAHRLTVEDLHYIAFSDFLISKNSNNFTLEQELSEMGPLMVGEFYDNLHDLFYYHLNAHAMPYMTDICHVPYHLNTFKPKNLPVYNYQYACILAHEQIIFTQSLMRTKHLLRKESISESAIGEIRTFIEKFTTSPHSIYQYVLEESAQEMLTMNAGNKNMANLFFYHDMIISPIEDKWKEFFEFFGVEKYFWEDKNRIMDMVYTYHEKNIELMLNFCTKREIEIMIDPMKHTKNIK